MEGRKLVRWPAGAARIALVSVVLGTAIAGERSTDSTVTTLSIAAGCLSAAAHCTLTSSKS
jgi:hypothetical protein